ncbi:hypothetical protein GBAR_LOCUS10181 [Geodia barretti]|uniref:NIPSNAP domain-containing protein n=1 Tax=Geodia barretti TaxID=519541 RepID=A0AA35RU50_GEOBA|nr:hypothetical protein GBAR_LOCUS10181 [Geodia barretti]
MYTLKPGATPDYRAGVKEVGLPIRQNHDVVLSGWYWSDIGTLNQVVHIWGYKDLEHLNSQKAAVYGDPRLGRQVRPPGTAAGRVAEDLADDVSRLCAHVSR